RGRGAGAAGGSTRRLHAAGVALVLAACAALAAPGLARADSFFLDSADVRPDVRADGSIRVTETIVVSFSGDFHYGYRDIPLREGESLVDPEVSENEPVVGQRIVYRSGGPTELAPGPAGRFGITKQGDGVRMVWYFTADSETRSFTIAYTLRGLSVGYDDVVDVDLQVWGDQWGEPLQRPTAGETAPGG